MKLSDNFSLIEFTKSQTAERKGIENTPNEIHTIAMEALCHNILERVRSAFAKPVMINSGYRSPALCEAIGSKSTSQHCNGEAADIEIYGVSNYDLAKYIENNLNFQPKNKPGTSTAQAQYDEFKKRFETKLTDMDDY